MHFYCTTEIEEIHCSYGFRGFGQGHRHQNSPHPIGWGLFYVIGKAVNLLLRFFAAEILHTAGVAIRLAGGADGSAVKDEAVTEVVALVGGEQSAQDGFDLLLVGFAVQSESSGDADTVGVHDDGAGHTEDIAHDEVRGLSSDAGQSGQLVEGMGDFAVVTVAQHARHRDDIL